MTEQIYQISNMWKKNTCFFWTFVLLLTCEIVYLTSIEETATETWIECINFYFVMLWALPALIVLGYILFKRMYMPKAKKGTLGIAFYVINAKEKQHESICKKFIERFGKAVSSDNPKYSIIIIDEYHSQKYFSILSQPIQSGNGEKQAKILKRRRCCGAIFIDCMNGGEGEALFCRMTMQFGISHRELPQYIRDYMVKDISEAFEPLREIDISIVSQTPDFLNQSFALEIIYKYILASTCFHCGDFLGALKLLETIERSLIRKSDLPSAVVPIKNVLENRIAVCYRVLAQNEYQLYCSDRDESRLKVVRNALSNEHCAKIYGSDNKILEGICSFVLDGNIEYAIDCMDAFTIKDQLVKFNKVFLMLYERCSTKTVFRAYDQYKEFSSLRIDIQEQIESFTFHEYKKNSGKKQLLLILLWIYDYQNNTILAKRCLEQFCQEFPEIVSGPASVIFQPIVAKYKDVSYDMEEEYSI